MKRILDISCLAAYVKNGQRLFEPFLYRFRGVGEGVFGARAAAGAKA